MMSSLGPWLGLLVPHAIMLAVGFVVVEAARRRPEATALGLTVTILFALLSLACAAFIVDGDYAVYWLMPGLVLLILGLPASIPFAIARQRTNVAFSWTGIADCLRLFGALLCDPFLEHRPSERAREIGRLVGSLFAYVAGCWLMMIAVSVVSLLAGPPGSFR
jgi:hypothetical protein